MQETGLTVALSDGLAVSVVAKEAEQPVHAGSIKYTQGHVWGSKSIILKKTSSLHRKLRQTVGRAGIRLKMEPCIDQGYSE